MKLDNPKNLLRRKQILEYLRHSTYQKDKIKDFIVRNDIKAEARDRVHKRLGRLEETTFGFD
jgi:hypothetical protein